MSLPPRSKAGQKPHPPELWEKIRASYIEGKGSLLEMSVRYSISPRTIESRSRREGWSKLRQQRSENALRKTLGGPAPVVLPGGIQTAEWWRRQEVEHLEKNLFVASRLRDEVERKISQADAGELEKLSAALHRIIQVERELLELDKDLKAPSPTLRAAAAAPVTVGGTGRPKVRPAIPLDAAPPRQSDGEPVQGNGAGVQAPSSGPVTV